MDQSKKKPVARESLAKSRAWQFGCRVTLLCVIALGAVMVPGRPAGAQDVTPQWLRQRLSLRVTNRRDNGDMMQLVQPIADSVQSSVVQVLNGGRPVALGTIVGADGYVLTKRSELSGDPIRVRLADDRLLPARVAAVRRQSDLALLRIESDVTLQPVQFDVEQPAVGSFLISPGRVGRPIGLGVLGVQARRVDHQGRLGVQLYPYAEGGALVRGIVADSGADQAGIELGDRIVAVNGRSQADHAAVQSALKALFPGEMVHLTIVRGDDTLAMDARIRELSLMQESENDTRVNGPRSVRLSGFEQAIQHDTVLNPDECGGPVLDSQGHVVGLNIARAGRVVSYALPSSLVVSEMARLLKEARADVH